jgi:hypothetical protein
MVWAKISSTLFSTALFSSCTFIACARSLDDNCFKSLKDSQYKICKSSQSSTDEIIFTPIAGAVLNCGGNVIVTGVVVISPII